MGEALKREDARYTYADYLLWPEEERWEIIHGTAYSMSPAPGRRHQALLGRLHLAFQKSFEGKPCEVYLAPFDVLFPDRDDLLEEDIDTVVQPDLIVICDPGKLSERGCRGAPDLVVEILSPHTARKDMAQKYELYESAGVKEYWIVDPGNRFLTIHVLGPEGRFGKAVLCLEEDTASSEIFHGLSVDLPVLFKDL